MAQVSKKLVDEAGLTSVANAIRAKTGDSAALSFPAGFVTAIATIPTGTTPTGNTIRVATTMASDPNYIEFSVPEIGDWKAFEVKRLGNEDGTSGTRLLAGSKTLGVAGCTYISNSGSNSRNCWNNEVFIDTEPAAMSVVCKVLTRANSLVVFRNGTNVNYTRGKTYQLTLYYGDAPAVSFSIDGTTYQADAGMTWAEWCNSAYNTGGFVVFSGGAVGIDTENYVAYTETARVSPLDYILTPHAYILGAISGGGADD